MREVRDILAAHAKWSGESLVMGTVVDVAGSSYRQPGARMLLRRGGERVGLISGGCLERDLVDHAFERTEDGPTTLLYDMRGNQFEPQGRYGSGCDGVVHLFLECLEPDGPTDVAVAALSATIEQRHSCVLATLFAGDGACEEHVGAKFVAGESDELSGMGVSTADSKDAIVTSRDAIVTSKDAIVTELPADIRESVVELLEEATDWRRPRTVRLESGDDKAGFLVEPLRPPLDLLIFGAGDDAQPVAEMAHSLGWDVRIADQWPVLATRGRFPGARDITSAPVEKLLDQVRVADDTHVLLMTHDFEADAQLLPEILEHDPAFVGLLGPRRRTRRLVDQLHKRDQLPNPEALERVQTPLGVDLGGEAPSEVALSILGGVLASHTGRGGGLLQSGKSPIHDEHERITRRIEETP